MEENTEDQQKEMTGDTKEDTEDIEELVDMSNFEHIEKILENDSSTNLKFLEFERQMFLDSIYNDGLVICAK